MRRPLIIPTLIVVALVAVGIAASCTLPSDSADNGSKTPAPTTVPTSAATFEIETPESITPTPAAQAGRPDCPQDWAAYEDPDGYFSICYPMEWGASVSEPQAYFGHTLSLHWPPEIRTVEPENARLTIYWSESSAIDAGLVEPCDLPDHWQNVKEIETTISGRNVITCVGDIVDFEDPDAGEATHQGTSAEVPLDDGYIVFFLFQSKQNSTLLDQDVASILNSLIAES